MKGSKAGLVAGDIAGQVLGHLAISTRKRLRVKGSDPSKRSSPSVPERQRELIDFYEQYESLVETLCDAARCGPDIVLDRRYFEARSLMQLGYPSLKPFLISYLDFHADDVEAGLKLCGRPLDAFEALVAPFDLQEFFKMDDGNMISRITRTREALNRYGEHLRQLAARAA